MTASALDTFTRQTSSGLITAYQKWLSPHKGFVCAHRVLHRAESCSQYAKRAIVEEGFWRAIPLIQERFEDCRVANEILKSRGKSQQRLQRLRSLHTQQGEPPTDPNAVPDFETPLSGVAAAEAVTPKRKSCQENYCNSLDCQGADCGDALDCLDIFEDGTDCLSDCNAFEWQGFDCSNLDCGMSDCSAFDCGSLDCGSLDCGSMDCGSCG